MGPQVTLSANPTGKSVPNSPGNAAAIASAFKAQTSKTAAPTPGSGSTTNKMRKLTTSVSSSAIPQPSKLAQSGYHTNTGARQVANYANEVVETPVTPAEGGETGTNGETNSRQ